MAIYTYLVSFRISDDTVGGRTYSQRRQSLVEKARQADAGFWDGTTSFIVAQSSLSTPAFAKEISAGLSSSHDMLIVIDPSDMSLAQFGQVSEAEVLSSFFRFSQKV